MSMPHVRAAHRRCLAALAATALLVPAHSSGIAADEPVDDGPSSPDECLRLAGEACPITAAALLREGARRWPDSTALHTALHVRLGADGTHGELVRAYDELAARAPAHATVAWYRAEARLAAGHAARIGKRWDDAEALYASAGVEYLRSSGLRADYGPSAERRAYDALLGRAWSRHGADDLRGAAALFAEAIAQRPELLREAGDFGWSPKAGADSVAVRLMEKNDLEGGEALLARLTAAVPELVDWWTNLGYFRWELGRWREGDERGEDARATYEQALVAYERARALAPDDPGALNDCVLILYYHLRRDDERVERYLRRAIESGTGLLAEGAADPARRDHVEEATGNAYQNLGVFLFEKRNEHGEAKRLLEKSLTFRPPHRAQARWYLARVERALEAELSAADR